MLHPFFAQLLPLDPDARVETVADHFDQLLQHMQQLERQEGNWRVSPGCHSGDKASVRGLLGEGGTTGGDGGVRGVEGRQKEDVAVPPTAAAAGGGGETGRNSSSISTQAAAAAAARSGQESNVRAAGGKGGGTAGGGQGDLLGDDFDSLLSDVDLVQKQLQGLRGLRDAHGEEDDDGIFLEGEGSSGTVAAAAPTELANAGATAAAAATPPSVVPGSRVCSSRGGGQEQSWRQRQTNQQQQQQPGGGVGGVGCTSGVGTTSDDGDGDGSGMVLMAVLLCSLLRGSLLQESKVSTKYGT